MSGNETKEAKMDGPASLEERFAGFSTYKGTPSDAIALFAEGRRRCPVPHSNELGGFYLLLRYRDVRQALINARTFANGPAVLRSLAEGMPRFPPIDYDPPEHTAWRRIFVNGINADTARRIAPLVRKDVIRYLDEIAPRGTCDLVADLTERVPMSALFHVLGLGEEDHDFVRNMTLELLASVADREAFGRVFAEFGRFGLREVERRRSEPKDDYLTALANAEIDGRLLNAQEIAAATNSLLLAGHGTTVAAMTNMLYEVLRRPELTQALIADPTLIPAAVEEALRLHTPFFGLYRRVTEDTVVSGVPIAAGESVYVCWQSANRDADVYPDPDEFKLDRPDRHHLTFGAGKHSCAGAATARMELATVMEELLRRLPDIELVDPKAAAFQFLGGETAAITCLPARFTPN